jgi:RNA polymerase sigma factor (sigma-70 family)
MSTAQRDPMLRYLRKLVAQHHYQERSDRQLLDDFAARRQEAAFAALVGRHGLMVLRVCRRVLGHEQDAEDAFQATFLVLARGSRSIRKQDALADWLHGVAYRTAMNAKRTAARRRRHELYQPETQAKAPDKSFASASGPSNSLTWNEVQAVLDEELRKVSAPYRQAFMLCVLEGKSEPEAAAILGCKPGTVSSRLARARQQLQRRLTRRGIQLGALLAALTLAESGSGALAGTLAQTTIKYGLLAAAGAKAAAQIPAHVSALAKGVSGAMLSSKIKIVTVVLLAACLLAAGAGVVAHPIAAIQPAPEKQSPQVKAPHLSAPGDAKAAVPVTNTADIRGRVLGPDGKPMPEARVTLWPASNKNPLAQTTADPQGRFRLSAPKTLCYKAMLVATAEGRAPDWRQVSMDRLDDITLRLASDDVPINGRVLNLEGRPVAGALVRVLGVEKNPDGNLAPWIDGGKKGYWLQWKRMPPETLGLPASVTTDRDGRFRLAGVGKERLVFLKVEGPDIEYTRFHVMTRLGKPPAPGGHHGVYPATFEHIAGPGRTAVGTVRDAKTRQPLAGITVADAERHNWTVTDKDGSYTLAGLPKQTSYNLTTGGKMGLPYFEQTRWGIASGPGLVQVTADFELQRGTEIRGRLTNKLTGMPLSGYVNYFPLPQNPNLDEFNRARNALAGDWGTVQPDGSFAVLGVPGPAILTVSVESGDQFPVVDAQAELRKKGVYSWPSGPTHSLIEINAAEKDPKSLHYDISLSPGRTRRGIVLGPDGSPLVGVQVAGIYARYTPTQKLNVAEFVVKGLRDGQTRVLVFVDLQRRLGKVQEVRGADEGRLTVRLEPLGRLTGRIVDGAGHPLAAYHVAAFPDLKRKGYINLPEEMVPYGTLGLTEGAWYTMTGRRAVTGADGGFRIEGLLPAVPYTVVAADETIQAGKQVTHERHGITAAAGQTCDLGDVKPQPIPKE